MPLTYNESRRLFLIPHCDIARCARHFTGRILLLENAAGRHGIRGSDDSALSGIIGTAEPEGDFKLAMSHGSVWFDTRILPSRALTTWTKFGDKLSDSLTGGPLFKIIVHVPSTRMSNIEHSSFRILTVLLKFGWHLYLSSPS